MKFNPTEVSEQVNHAVLYICRIIWETESCPSRNKRGPRFRCGQIGRQSISSEQDSAAAIPPTATVCDTNKNKNKNENFLACTTQEY